MLHRQVVALLTVIALNSCNVVAIARGADIQSGFVFRELRPGFIDSWNAGPGLDTIDLPGWDHVGLLVPGRTSPVNPGIDLGVVWESHPGYGLGGYFDPQVGVFGSDAYRTVDQRAGVQNQHTRGTFFHLSDTPSSSPVADGALVTIDSATASRMASKIASVNGAPFERVRLSTFLSSASPAAQKGADGSFSCVGLMEWAAEQSGYNSGKGFIPDYLESLHVPLPRLPGLPPTSIDVPALSPSLLYWFAKGQGDVIDADRWIQGVLDPVDFLLTDPLGRRFGVVDGVRYDEIPGTLYTGDGLIEQFLIPSPATGSFAFEIFGSDEKALGGIAVVTKDGVESGVGVDQFIGNHEVMRSTITSVPEPSTIGLGIAAVIGWLIFTSRHRFQISQVAS
jgi:hypothetical protein